MIETHHEVTERVRTEHQLRELASTDGLTKIYNRAKFDQELKHRFEARQTSGQSLALIMFDIDHFKQINDRHGHDIGDQVLIEIVQLVRKYIRKDDLLARWGGEEFMILVSGTDLVNIEKMASHLQQVVEQHHFPSVKKVTASFGLTTLLESDSIESLIKRVDSALYQSKRNGRNRVTTV